MTNANILIAEDENIIAKDISKTLERLGYNVIGTCRSGNEIISKTGELKPDLVLMDIMLAGEMTGIEAAQHILSIYQIPVIYLTALADEETLNKAKITEPFGYIIKPFDKQTLNTSIEMALYKHKMNFKLRQRTLELEEEREKSNTLLLNLFPAELVKELKEKGSIAPREYSKATMLFTDFQDFTSIASKISPTELVEELTDIFENFDSIIEKHKIEKLKTMGDSYIVVGGIPEQKETHAHDVVEASIEMFEYLDERNKSSDFNWIMRAGIHTGKVIAGVVGKNKLTYDVWGNTVNIASQMEKLSQPGKIHITSETYNLVKKDFNCESKGEILIPGNGSLESYFITRKT